MWDHYGQPRFQCFLCGQRRHCSDYADAQADLSRRWRHTSESTFSHVAIQISLRKNIMIVQIRIEVMVYLTCSISLVCFQTWNDTYA